MLLHPQIHNPNAFPAKYQTEISIFLVQESCTIVHTYFIKGENLKNDKDTSFEYQVSYCNKTFIDFGDLFIYDYVPFKLLLTFNFENWDHGMFTN